MTTPPFHHPASVLDGLPRTHRRVGVLPGDESLRYVMPVPREWGRATAVAANPGAGRAELLGLFAPAADLSGPRIIVSAARLRYDVDPCDWVRHAWEQAGWTIAVARPLEPRWSPRFEVGAFKRIDGEVEIRRATGFVDNGRLVRVDVAASWSRWPELHDLTWPCGVLLSLAQPTYRRRVEATHRYGGPLVAFELPASWRARPAPPARHGTTRWLARPLDEVQGAVLMRIDATPWSDQGPRAVAERQRQVRYELARERISMARRVERLPAGSVAGTPGLSGLFRAKAHDNDQDYELRFAHRDVDGMSVDYVVVISSPTRCPVDRMRATRALEIALSTTQTNPREETDAA